MVSDEEIIAAEAAELISGLTQEEAKQKPAFAWRLLKAVPFMLRDLPYGIGKVLMNLGHLLGNMPQ